MIDLNPAAWAAHHAAIYGGHEWPSGTVASVMARRSKDAPLFPAGFAPIADADAIWALVSKLAARGADTFVSVGGLDGEMQNRKGRGTKHDVVGLPALVVDIDFAGFDHSAGDRNPTPAEAIGWVDQYASLIEPAVVNHSGGGAHLWIATEMLDWENGDHHEMMARHKLWWLDLAEEAGRNIDASVLHDPARILRPAGTFNAKQGRPVKTTRPIGQRRYTVEELLDILPAPRKTVATVISLAPAASVSTSTSVEKTRAGDRFAREVPVSLLCAEVFLARLDESSRITFPRDDGSYAEDSNAAIYPATDAVPEKLTVFGQRVLDEFNITEGHSLTSFDLLANICGTPGTPDYKKAASLLRQTESGGWAQKLLPMLHAKVTGQLAATPDDDESDKRLSIRDALEAGEETTVILEDGLFVRVGRGQYHGLFMQTWLKNEEGVLIAGPHKRITSWVGWKRSQVRHLGVSASGDPLEEIAATYTLEVVDSFGRMARKAAFTAKEAHNPSHVLNELDLGLTLPQTPLGIRQVESMLRAVGRHDSMESLEEFHTLGWMRDPDSGKHVYLAPAGSVNADGPCSTFTVGAPTGSQEGAGTAAAQGIGYPDIPQTPEDIREAGRAIKSFLAIVPGRLDIGAALIGILFAAPLALSRRTTLFLVAAPDSGKTLLITAAQAFMSGHVSTSSFTGGPAGLDSVVAAQVKTSYLRHAVGFWDDYALTEEPTANARIKNLATNVIRLSYGTDGQTGGTQTGGLRTTRTADTCSVFTGEGTPTGDGVVSRIVRIVVNKGDVAHTPAGTSAFDTFIKGGSGAALEFYGAYLQWLAEKMDTTGLKDFTARGDKVKAAWLDEGAGRTAETVAVLAAGWSRLREFARARGCEDILPSESDINKALESLISTNVEAVKEANPAASIIDRVRDQIASKNAYIDTWDGEQPADDIARTLGWEKVSVYIGDGMNDEVWKPGYKMRAGVLSKDRRYVVITNDAIRRIKKETGMEAVPADQMERSAMKFVLPGTTPGGRSPAELVPNRARGWVVKSSAMDIDLEPAAPDAGETVEFEVPDNYLEVF